VPQLSCDGVFSTHFISNFQQNVAVKFFFLKIGSIFGDNMDNVAHFFGATLYMHRLTSYFC